MKYAILTFGCRTNQADSFAIARNLRAEGGEEVAAECADLVVVNTCSVTAAAEQGARQAIRRIVRLNPSARIVATGCYAGRQSSDFAGLPVSAIVQPQVVILPPAGRLASRPEGPNVRAEPDKGGMPGPGTLGRTIYLLKVQTGCNEACAYCVVPITRGPSRSVAIEEVLRDVSQAAAAGFKELMLTGVHLGGYGRDLAPSRCLADLVAALADCPADVTFRLSAIEPMDVDERLAGILGQSGRFAPHFHLPLQHGSNRVLRIMRRPYSIEQYRCTLEMLRHRFPDAALGTDVIVGFPGETESDFKACCSYVADSPLTYLHVFPFSPRPGTAAATLGNRPPGVEVRRRARQLRAIGSAAARRFRFRFVGSARNGLTIEDGSLVLTDNYLRVKIPPGLPRNERVRVRIAGNGESGIVESLGRRVLCPAGGGPNQLGRYDGEMSAASFCPGDFFCPSTIS